MENILAFNLSFAPPQWPVLLAVTGWVLLGVEAIFLWARLRDNRGAVRATLLSVMALLAGPVLLLVGLMRSTSTAASQSDDHKNQASKSEGLIVKAKQIVHHQRFEHISLTAAGLWGIFISGVVLLIRGYPCIGGVLAIGFCASTWAIRTYRRTTTPVSRSTRRVLLLLRILLILLLTAWALKPVLLHTFTENIRSVLLIGVDASASMAQKDMPPNYRTGKLNDNDELIARTSASERALWSESESIDAIAESTDLQCFTFAAQADATRKYDPDNATFWQDMLAASSVGKSATAIGDSVQEAFDSFAASGLDILGVLILSDGCNNTAVSITPEKLATRLAGRNVPVHTVCVGAHKASEGIRALTVTDIGAEQSVQAFSRIAIKPTVEIMGLEGRIVRVICKFGDETIGTKNREVQLQNEKLTFDFTYLPLQAGFHKLSVSAEVVGQPIRSLAGKPLAEMLVHVSDREMHVLYVEGKFRYETKYIARALAASERFSVHNFLMLRPLQSDRQPPLGETLEEWLRYHAIIFGDVSAKHFSKKQLEIIKELVSKYGKGFCMIGGQNSFGNGGWANTPIADIMPVTLADSKGQIDRLIQPIPTKEGELAPIMQIGPEGMTVKEAWAKLDPLPGANKLAGLKPAATVLAEASHGEPMIVIQQYGKGRTLAIAFDTTWRWALSPNLKGSTGRDMLQRFWRQVVLYLADPKGNVWIHTNRTTYDSAALARGSEEILVTAGVEDAQGRSVEQAKYEVVLINPAGKSTPITLARDDKLLKTTLQPPKTKGIYTLRLSAELAGRKIAAEHKFEIITRNMETGETLADFQQLKRIAKAGGGQAAQLKDLHDLLEILRTASKPRTREVTKSEDILGKYRWWVFFILLALLCTEWSLRKKKGLV